MSSHTPTSYDVDSCHRHVIRIHIYHWILHLLFDNFNYCLSNVWKAFESHQDSQVLVFTKWCDDVMGVLTFVVKLKCIVLHTNIKFSEKLVPRTFAQNVHDHWQWILDPAYSVVFFESLFMWMNIKSFIKHLFVFL